ncbi:hypothetical protein Aple_095550 [Acrocarpospora pleiomorpha]|uniref:DUF4331 domain-containing protein n=1 Tax=Acrocarpospora pleiomorpha TaxID=90975 RepID=A0A5M3Y0D0_9ACTN|nr:DUF4331 domain-containing protein [Acrocarpospora pleiomorpha]GES26656.1 hypothetical protein Aple_095550 [Acrocarpospora pleiomorpha]
MNQASKRIAVVGVGGSMLAAGFLAGPGTSPGLASNRVDAPTQILDPQMDVTDLYAFTSPDRPDTVTVIWNYVPFELPIAPLPWYRFATQGFYDLHFDSTGDGRPELTYRWWFRNGDGSGDPKAKPSGVYPDFGKPLPQGGDNLSAYAGGAGSGEQPPGVYPYTPEATDPNAGRVAKPCAGNVRCKTLFPQTYRLEVIRPGQRPKMLLANAPVGPYSVEPKFAEKWKRAIVPLPGGGQTFSGQVKDPFFVDFRAIALTRVGLPVAPPVGFSTPFNVHSIAIQVPKSELALGGDVQRNPVVGIWATSSRRSLNLLDKAAKPYRQVSRQGLSMFGDSLMPHLLRDAYHNASSPQTDHKWSAMIKAVHHPYASKLLAPGLLALPPKEPRIDLEQVFLTGIAKSTGPIKMDLTSHMLNRDADRTKIVPAEMTRLNMMTPVTPKPNQYGLIGGDPQGWPNGRRLTDNVTVAFIRMAMGEPAGRGTLLPTWLSPITGPAKRITDSFPYLATPDIRASVNRTRR